MILLTVGTQLPFDRLVKAVDQWAENHPEVEIIAQVANGEYRPRHFETVDFLDERTYKDMLDRADTIVAHAAMGSIISSLLLSKPVIVFPRKASLGEHRNEHQLATCHNLAHLEGCYVSYDEPQLFEALDNIGHLQGGHLGRYANDDLLNTIDQFISSH